MTLALQDSRALVTGAAGGLGRAIARTLASAGADVAVQSRRRERLDEVIDDVLACGRDARAVVGGLEGADAVRAVVRAAGPVDILVTSAGTNVPQALADVERSTFDALFAINVRAAFFAMQAVARSLLADGRPGAIVHVSSQMGHVGAANRTVYCATKHAVEGMTKAAAVELAPHGVRVNTVAPTYVETPMTALFLAEAGFRAGALARIPAGRLGLPEDVAAAVRFLVSPGSELVTGTSIVVDGGYTAQ